MPKCKSVCEMADLDPSIRSQDLLVVLVPCWDGISSTGLTLANFPDQLASWLEYGKIFWAGDY